MATPKHCNLSAFQEYVTKNAWEIFNKTRVNDWMERNKFTREDLTRFLLMLTDAHYKDSYLNNKVNDLKGTKFLDADGYVIYVKEVVTENGVRDFVLVTPHDSYDYDIFVKIAIHHIKGVPHAGTVSFHDKENYE